MPLSCMLRAGQDMGTLLVIRLMLWLEARHMPSHDRLGTSA